MEVPEWKGAGSIDDAVALVMGEMLRNASLTIQDSVCYTLSRRAFEAAGRLWAIPTARRVAMYDEFRTTLYGPLREGIIRLCGVAPSKERTEMMREVYETWLPFIDALRNALMIPFEGTSDATDDVRWITRERTIAMDFESGGVEPGGAVVRVT